MRGDLIVVVAHLPHVRNLGVIGLPQQSGEPAGIKQTVLPPMHCHHAEAERLLAHGRSKLAEGLGHELEGAGEGKTGVGSDLARRARGTSLFSRLLARPLPVAPAAPAPAAPAGGVGEGGRGLAARSLRPADGR